MTDQPILDDLLVRIDDAFEHDLGAPSERLRQAAQQAFTWRVIDDELAELLFDSANDELVGVRGVTTERRSFRFAAHDFVIRIHLTNDSMIAMIEPPLSVSCRVVTEDGATEHRTDDMGELVVDVPDMPVRFEVDLPAGTTVSPWIIG